MDENDAPVFIFKTHQQGEDAIRLVMRSGFDPEDLSLVGKEYHSEQQPAGGRRLRDWRGADPAGECRRTRS